MANKERLDSWFRFDENACERYLFGEMSEHEREEFEEAYFVDDGFFEKFLAFKLETLDAYSRGDMDAPTRARFEPHFLATPPRRKQIAEANEFITAITRHVDRRVKNSVIPVVTDTWDNKGWIVSLFEGLWGRRLTGLAVLLAVVLGGLWLSHTLIPDLPHSSEQAAAPIQPEPAGVNGVTDSVADKPKSDDVERASSAGLGREPVIIIKGKTPSGGRSTIRHRQNRTSEDRPHKETARNTKPATDEDKDPPANERASTGFALTLSTVGRDNTLPGSGPNSDLTRRIILRPGTAGSIDKSNKLVLRSGVDTNPAGISVLFKSKPYPDYVVTITNNEGDVILKEDDFDVEQTTEGQQLLGIWLAETSSFRGKSNDYVLKLEGRSKSGDLETIDEYNFSVERVAPREDPSIAQYGELIGKVAGPDGKAVSNATVIAKNLDYGITRSVLAGPDGWFRIPLLPPGEYEVSSEAAGLKRTVISAVPLAVNQQGEVRINMTGGEAAAVVTVMGDEVEKGENRKARIEHLLTKRSTRPQGRYDLKLFPGKSSGPRPGSTLQLIDSAKDKFVSFVLVFKNAEHQRYSAVIETARGREIWKGGDLDFAQYDSGDWAVYVGLLGVPLFSEGEYKVTLTGHRDGADPEMVNEYYFRVRIIKPIRKATKKQR